MPAQTKRQHDVLAVITRSLETNGYRPSYQSIAKVLGLRSRAGIARIVHDLESQGLLERQRENGHFTIKIKNPGSMVSVDWLDVPGNIHETAQALPLTLPSFMIGTYDPDDLRIMRITDPAMAPEIEVDDLALIELRDYCRPGQPVVTLLHGETAVLRKYYRVNSEIELRPASEDIKSIIVPANEVEIIGIYRGLVRPAV